MKTDAQLKQDILEELNWDPAVNATEVGVIVKDGVVTLTGHLSHYAEKYAIEQAVRRVHGVQALAVEMDVHLQPSMQRNDTDLASSAELALRSSVLVPSNRIQVVVEKAWLTLTGEVQWEYQRRAAERAVRELPGVLGVSNSITVNPGAQIGRVEQNIHDALARQADRQARHVKVAIEGSQVILRGHVHSWAERMAAQGAAWSAPGVTSVLNELKVDA